MAVANRVFKHISVIPDWERGHVVQWQLDPFFKAVRPYNFSLEIAENDAFNELIATKKNLGEVFFAVDDTRAKQSWEPNYAYRVCLTAADGKRYNSYPVLFGTSRQERQRYAMAAEVIRKEILLCRYGGASAWLLRRKSYGGTIGGNRVAHKNIDPVSGVPIADTKLEDYGVGVDEGYFPPVPCTFIVESTDQDKQLDPSGIGVKEKYSANIRMPGYPITEVRDIICDAQEGVRYSVSAKNTKQFPGTSIIILQKLSMNVIPISDTIYSIPIPATFDFKA